MDRDSIGPIADELKVLVKPFRDFVNQLSTAVNEVSEANFRDLFERPYINEVYDRRESVRHQGATDGRNDNPPADAKDLSSAEKDIRTYWQRAVIHIDNEARNVSDSIQRIAQIERNQPQVEIFGHIVERIRRQCTEIRRNKEGILEKTVEALEKRHRNLNYFREIHRITTEATYPQNDANKYGIIVFVIIIESMLNSLLFAKASTEGLLGGFLIALIVSLINVGFATFAGYFFRYRNVRREATRNAIQALVPFAIVFSIFLNYLVAKYRDAVATGQIQRFGEQPSGPFLGDLSNVFSMQIESYLLLFLGLIIAAFAAFKGYKLDDEIPGYGERDRAYNQAMDDYENLRNEYRQEIVDLVNEGHKALDQRIADVGEIAVKLRAAADAAIRLNETHSIILNDINNEFGQELATYRDANSNVRLAPKSAYFADKPPRLEARFQGVDPAPLHAQAMQTETEFKNLQANLMDNREKLNNLVDEVWQDTQAYFDKVRTKVRTRVAEEDSLTTQRAAEPA